MGNDQDKQFQEDITKIFDRSGAVLAEMQAELFEILNKYGTESKLLKRKTQQFEQVRELYDKSLTYINYLRQLNHSMYIEFMSEELVRHSRETGLPISKVAALAGQDPTPWKAVDEWDERLQRIRTRLQIPEDRYDLERFIERLKGGQTIV
jgi:hypothetical protein